MQTEKSGTLGTGNDQTIFCLQGNGIDRADTAGCNGKGWKTDESYTLNTIDRHAVCAEVACMNPWDAQSAGFPLIFERIHGKGTARWASEIEPFPIAVTKKWFGEE